MNPEQVPCGVFGKLPQAGDFISRHLPDAFTSCWHRWLQAGLAVSQEQLGDNWLPAFLTAPIWHFALDGGVCGNQAAVGVLMPSVDEVGRYFPLTVVHLGGHRLWAAYLDESGWYPLAESVALKALDDESTRDDVLRALDELAMPRFEALPRICVPATGACAVELGDTARTSCVIALGEYAQEQLLGPRSLWWSRGSAQVAPALLVCAGLPEPGQLAAMLDGDWQSWGWSLQRLDQGDRAP